jgi:hypothetical protein
MAVSLPDPTYDAESTRRLYPSLPIFEGFPYLVTRVVPAMYHGILLPADASELELVLLARTQWRANRLEVCLVIGEDRAWFWRPRGLRSAWALWGLPVLASGSGLITQGASQSVTGGSQTGLSTHPDCKADIIEAIQALESLTTS